jgi:exopolyphosphatase/guanosine-5'-triphosphate,3'-diphosphate pyrophosphatase
MRPARRAIIDVGTNSIKLLVADVTGHDVRPVCEESKQTRLGSGFYETRRLQAGAIKSTAEAVATFAGRARENNADSIRVIATSAAREALNASELTSAIQTASGLPMQIISGELEADWAFQGVTTDPALAMVPLLLLDVGGGSTEFILGQGEQKHLRASFPLGTVRLMEKTPRSDPPRPEELKACREWLSDFLRREVRPVLEPAMRKEISLNPGHKPLILVGTGGTASILARIESRIETYDRDKIEKTRLSLDRVRAHTEALWALKLAHRQTVVGLPKNRADVILMGAAIYEAVMSTFGFEELRISTRGLRFAAVMEVSP